MITHKIVNGQTRQLWLNDTDEEDFYDDESPIEDSYEGVSDPNNYDTIQDSYVEDPQEE